MKDKFSFCGLVSCSFFSGKSQTDQRVLERVRPCMCVGASGPSKMSVLVGVLPSNTKNQPSHFCVFGLVFFCNWQHGPFGSPANSFVQLLIELCFGLVQVEDKVTKTSFIMSRATFGTPCGTMLQWRHAHMPFSHHFSHSFVVNVVGIECQSSCTPCQLTGAVGFA